MKGGIKKAALLFLVGVLITFVSCTESITDNLQTSKQSEDIVSKEDTQQKIPVDPGGKEPAENVNDTPEQGLEPAEEHAQLLKGQKGAAEGDNEGASKQKDVSNKDKAVDPQPESDAVKQVALTEDAKGEEADTTKTSDENESLEKTSDSQPPATKQTEDKVEIPVTADTEIEPINLEAVKVTEESTEEAENETVTDTAHHTETTDEATESKTDADKTGQEEFQTFTEFFEQNKQEEEEKSKQNTLADLPGTKITPVKQAKRKINVASTECGAKIIASNPEAENAKGVLTSNKDDYMINPCKAKKWFVIELCEPVRVKFIEIASYELFSSQPKSFRVQFSEEYPSKVWHAMEPFTATEARVVQSFPVPEKFNDYFKFVKVEMVDHFGEEHYCPLTIFKVMGVPVEYEDLMGRQSDEDENMDSGLMHDGEGDGSQEKDGPKNLFTSAKDTVLKIVKKVLNVDDDEKEQLNKTEDGSTDIESSNSTDSSFMLPCVPGVSSSKVQADEQTSDKIMPSATVPATKDSEQVSIVTKLEDHEQVPSEQPLVTLIDSEMSVKDMVSKCLSANGSKTRKISKLKGRAKRIDKGQSKKFCVYIRLMLNYGRVCIKRKLIPPVSQTPSQHKDTCSDLSKSNDIPGQCEKQKENSIHTTSAAQDETAMPTPCLIPTPTDTKPADRTQQPPPQKSDPKKAEPIKDSTINNLIQSSTVVATPPVPSSTSLSASAASSNIHSSLPSVNEVKGQKPINDVKKSPTKDTGSSAQEQITPSMTEISEDKHQDKLTTPTLELKQEDSMKEEQKHVLPTKSVNEVTKKDDVTPKAVTPEPVSSDDNSVTPSVSQAPVSPESNDTMDKEAAAMEQMIDRLSSVILDVPQNEDKNVSQKNEETLNKEEGKKDLGLVKVPILPFPKREIALMRLANRINALEMNVSLSIRFLERMSQKFKTKSDDLVRMLNKTDKKLEVAITESSQQNKAQQEQITKLEREIQNLTNIVFQLTQNMESLKQKVTDRQMVWTSVEVVILFVIFIMCLRRGKPGTPTVPPEVQKLLDQIPKEPDPLVISPRRNSYSGTSRRDSSVAKKSLQKYSSETALACKVNNKSIKDISSFDPGGTSSTLPSGGAQQKEITKKKKKKRKSSEFKIQSVPPGGGIDGDITPTESVTNFNSAGLLFGSSSSEDSFVQGVTDQPNQNSINPGCQGNHYCRGSSNATLKSNKGDPKDCDSVVKFVSFKDVHCDRFTPGSSPIATSGAPSNSVIASKPPRGNQSTASTKVIKGSPPVSRANLSSGGTANPKNKKHIIPNNHFHPGETVQSIGAKSVVNGIHNNTKREITQQKPFASNSFNKKQGHVRASSADFSPTKASEMQSWKKIIVMK